jgi:3-oxoacyl-[acyl-carrier-protein] synthase-3
MAAALVNSGVYRRVLLVGAEVHSTGLDLSTRGRDIAVLFGDGAGSCLIESVGEKKPSSHPAFEVLETELHCDGGFVKELWCEAPGSSHFPQWCSKEMVEEGRIFPFMNGKVVFENAVRRMTETSLSVLKKVGLTPDDVRLFVPHQANLRINRMVGAQIGLSKEQVFSTIQKYGNTTAATIPIGMADVSNEVELGSGDIILNAAFGSGFTWAASVLRVL